MDKSHLLALRISKAQATASKLEAIIELRRNDIVNLLSSVQSRETTDDEIFKTLDYFHNIKNETANFGHNVGTVCTFLPLNLPLYSTVLFGVVPSFMARAVQLRPPTILYSLTRDLADLLELGRVAPEIAVTNMDRTDFCKTVVPFADVTIFTGKPNSAMNVLKATKKDSLFIFNGRGVNPIVIGENADITLAVEKTLQVKLFNSGQDCAAPDCIFIHKDASEVFISTLLGKLGGVRIGDYSDPLVQVGPLIEADQMKIAAEAIFKNRRNLIAGGTIDFQKAIVHPAVIYYENFARTNHTEFFSPIFFITEYRDDSDLRNYFESTAYRGNAMYISLFGESDYIQSQQHSVLLRDCIIHDVERGYKEYGGYSHGASFVSVGRQSIAKPILISREIAMFSESRHELTNVLSPGKKLDPTKNSGPT